MHQLIHGDVLTVEVEGQFHACLCDPPYHLYTEAPTWRVKLGEARTEADKQARRRYNGVAKGGFMGKHWDGGDIAFRPETWAKIGEHLLPGAFLMAFGSARTYHRMACAIEEAGFRILPAIYWLNGSSFPKATRIRVSGHSEVCECESPQLVEQTWAGHRYGGQVLKEACVPIVVAQKPYEGKPVESITRTGAGALNVEGGRIPTVVDDPNARSATGDYSDSEGGDIFWLNHHRPATLVNGRWPANLVIDDSVVGAVNRQSGERPSGGGIKKRATGSAPGIFDINKIDGAYYEASTGGASRFFYRTSWALEEQEPFFYCAKSSRRERDAGLEGMPKAFCATMGDGIGAREHNPEQPTAWVHNPHPTLKPLALCKYLANLLLPPAEYAPRRILVPFAGTGSEMIGAGLAGWEEVVGIEMETEYCDLAEKRLAHWLAAVPVLLPLVV